MPDDLISKQSRVDARYLTQQGGEWLFVFSLGVFGVALLLLGGLFLFQRSLETNAKNWQDQIRALENELRPDLLNQLILFSDRLAGAREIVSNHIFGSNVFLLLEKNTHPKVVLLTFHYSADSRKIELTAKAANYRSVSEQITFFEADSNVESVSFGGLTLDEKGLVNFKLSVTFKPGLLRLRPQ